MNEDSSNSLISGLVIAAANAAANSASNSVNNAEQWEYQQKQNQWNADQATLAYQRQLEFWDKQNEYNSPVQQIARLRAAGINPSLAYSNGNIQNVSNNTPSVNSSESQLTGTYKGLDLTNIGSNFINAFTQSETIKQIKAQTDKIQKENVYQGIQNQIKLGSWLDELHSLQHKFRSNNNLEKLADEALEAARLENDKLRYEVNFQRDSYDTRLSSAQLENESIRINNSLRNADLAIQRARVPYAHKMVALEYKAKVQELSNMYLNGLYTKAQTNLAYQQALTELSTRNLNKERENTEKSSQGMLDAQKSYYGTQNLSGMVDATRKSIEIGFDYPSSALGHLIDDNGYINAKMVDDYMKSILNAGVAGVIGFGAGKFSKRANKKALSKQSKRMGFNRTE